MVDHPGGETRKTGTPAMKMPIHMRTSPQKFGCRDQAHKPRSQTFLELSGLARKLYLSTSDHT
eukprot:scaffold258426_cov30-Tisochrysis_lutea.AAC.4